MKKSLVKLLSMSALALLALPFAVNGQTARADDGPAEYKVGGPALGSSYAVSAGTIVDPPTTTSASEQSQLGVGFMAGPLTLNQVPIFDFGVHQLGSSSKYSLQAVASAGFQPKPFADGTTPGGDDTAQGGMRSLVITDARNALKQTTGYSVSLEFGDLQKILTKKTTAPDGTTVTSPSLDSKGNFQIDKTASPITDAHLQFTTAHVSDGTLGWNAFLAGSDDPDFFKGSAAIYPGFFNPDPDVFKAGGAITTSNNRLKDDSLAPTQQETNIDQNKNEPQTILLAQGKTDTVDGQGYGTWVYDFSSSTSAYLAMPTQNEGFWVAQLTWTLTTGDPANQPGG